MLSKFTHWMKPATYPCLAVGFSTKAGRVFEISDLDFAVEGLNSVQMLQLLADAEERSNFLSTFCIGDLSPGVQQLVKLRGQIVYEFD